MTNSVSKQLIQLALVALGLLSSAQASAQVRFEIGGRFESLSLDGDFEFTCDCDPEEDPGCEFDPLFCAEASLDEPHSGFLVGPFVGVSGSGRLFGAGARLAFTLGFFEPDRDTANKETVELTHITFEIPLEAHVGLPGIELYAQAVPRIGLLNYADGNDEDADTFTAGVLLMIGARFGTPDARVGAAYGRVAHPNFSGWAIDAMYQGGMPGGPGP